MGIDTEFESEVIGTLYAASGKGLAVTQGVATAKGTAVGAATLAKGSAMTAFWKTTAFKVGMGVGLTSWTPIIIGGLIFAGAYTFFSAMQQVNAHLDTMEMKL